MRQIILDTETTGLEPAEGHRIIEIGCVEMVARRLTGNTFHQYLQPDRENDAGAIEVHGITNEFLADKPRFADIVDDFVAYIKGAELVIHNAPFDVGFINHELKLCQWNEVNGPGGAREGPPEELLGMSHSSPSALGYAQVADLCSVLDTLKLARKMHPGQKNNLDALCRRYEIDNTHRELHGALLDAEILADVYLAMTGGQVALSLGSGNGEAGQGAGVQQIRRLPEGRPALRVIQASADELADHRARLEAIAKAAGGQSVWEQLTEH
jgi:DNA polymerase-3 subunit epsilon